jgi:putative molybdopterin biosynthesis protein
LRKGIYLKNTPLNEAQKKWSEKIISEGTEPLKCEQILVKDSLGRVTAEAVFARISAPFYHSSAMDGYAVKFIDTFGASETSPKRLNSGKQAVYVDTGDPVPEGFNAVIMIEDVNIVASQKTNLPMSNNNHIIPPLARGSEEEIERCMKGKYGMEDECIEIIKPATPWQHVRVIGEDILCTELILPENHKIRPFDIGAIISGGHVEINVRRKPKVVIIPTGSELVEPGTELKKGDIIEYNSMILSSLVLEWGGEPVRIKPVPDDLNQIKKSIIEGCERGDLVVVNAGSSAGSVDFTAEAIAELGEVILHGINIKPGKPVILGWVRDRPVLGIPGYPVSAYITFNFFAKDLVYRLQGLDMPEPEFIKAKLSRQVASSLGQEEFLRVKVGNIGENLIATPVRRGAGVLMSLVSADGFVRISSMSEGLAAGVEVNVEMLRRKKEIENTIVCIGSHDNALDFICTCRLYGGTDGAEKR